MKTNPQASRGFVQLILLAIVIFVTLAYFNIDLHAIGSNLIVQKIWNILVVGWDTYLKPFFIYLFTSIAGLSGK